MHTKLFLLLAKDRGGVRSPSHRHSQQDDQTPLVFIVFVLFTHVRELKKTNKTADKHVNCHFMSTETAAMFGRHFKL